MVRIARVVIGAPASGSGKTTVATGLMAALSARGLVVSPHKVGPDYIDPTYHAIATGRPGRNLDPFLVGEQLIAPLFAHGARGADLAVIEGVMGLFDGRGATEEASTAHVARLLEAPVLLTVDASAQSSSVAALVHGFSTYDRRLTIAGLVLNRVASARHEALLREALEPSGIPVVGALPRRDELLVPSRHLGLVPVPERRQVAALQIAKLADFIQRNFDLDAVRRIAASAPELNATPWSATDALGAPVDGHPLVAIAAGPAFSFGYAETSELLAAAGAQIAYFDPLHDRSLPAGTRGLVLGGGFPQLHAEELSGNTELRADVARLAAAGAPVVAECAGLLYLSRSLDGAPMCGVLPVETRMTDRLSLGYREARHPDGTPVRAHEFHRTACSPASGEHPAYTLADGRPEGFQQGRVRASYLHVHWAGAPALARDLVGAA